MGDIEKRGGSHKAELIAYLKKALIVSFSPGYLDDFFGPQKMIGTHSMRTDGVHVWPEFVAGYVERYDVALPEEFEQRVAEHGWRLPEKLDRERFTLPHEGQGNGARRACVRDLSRLLLSLPPPMCPATATAARAVARRARAPQPARRRNVSRKLEPRGRRLAAGSD
jgi:hypothetical protein